jgi:hypothetical protein
MKYNTITKAVAATVPGGIYEGIDYHGEPPADVAARAGWVDVTPEIQAQIDRERTEAEAAQAAARLASFAPLIPHAALFRATLRKHFGANAETNREVTASTVADYFTGKQITGKITAAELADAIVLDKLFAELAAWGGTGETWSLPWEQVPG